MALSARQPGVYHRCLSALFHLYPLLSGCGTVANSRIARLLLAERSSAVWASVGGAECLVPLDDHVGRAIFLIGDLDRKVTSILSRCVGPGDTVLDVGANLGLVTLLLAQRVGPDGQVHAFEPCPATLAFLERTLERNPQLPVSLHKLALGAEEETLHLHVPPRNAGRASLVAASSSGQAESYRVEVRPLASLLSELGVREVALMKLDVEGFEPEVLEGTFSSKSPCHPLLILFEENHPARSRAFGLLEDNGYEIYGMPRLSLFGVQLLPRSASGFERCHDFLGVHRALDERRRRRLRLPQRAARPKSAAPTSSAQPRAWSAGDDRARRQTDHRQETRSE